MWPCNDDSLRSGHHSRAVVSRNVAGLERRADNIGRVPVGVTHDELGAREDIDQCEVSGLKPGLFKQLASRGLLECLAGFEATARQPPAGIIASKLKENASGCLVADTPCGG